MRSSYDGLNETVETCKEGTSRDQRDRRHVVQGYFGKVPRLVRAMGYKAGEYIAKLRPKGSKPQVEVASFKARPAPAGSRLQQQRVQRDAIKDSALRTYDEYGEYRQGSAAQAG